MLNSKQFGTLEHVSVNVNGGHDDILIIIVHVCEPGM